MDIRQGEKVEGERRMEELWAESVRRYNASKERDLRAEWRAHYRRMRGVHQGLADEYDRKLVKLEDTNGH
jgi:hypothetical protein